MPSISQEYTISTEKLNEKWEGLHGGFNDNPATNKEFEEKHQILLRLQRAISWLEGAQQVERGAEEKDGTLSAQFIFFWISFNALYDKNFHEFPDSKSREIHIKLIKEYFDDILGSEDAKYYIRNVIDNNNLTKEIDKLTRTTVNIFLQHKFFKRYYRVKERGKWLLQKIVKLTLRPKARNRNTREILYRVFECLCVLRNQVMHGGSALDDINEEQLFIGIKIMQHLIPVFIKMEKSDNNNSPSGKKELKGNTSFLLRADSWLNVAQKVEKGLEEIDKDINTQFIFLWIGFNAIYAKDEENPSEKKQIEECFQKLLKCNEAKKNIYKAIDNSVLKEKITSLEKNIILSKKFLKNEKVIAFPGWDKESPERILCYIFQRLRALRNELVHGHVAWDCKLKKSQLADSTKIMHQLLPVFIDIMLEIPEKEWKQWGKIWQPRVAGVGIKGKPFKLGKHLNPEKMKEIHELK